MTNVLNRGTGLLIIDVTNSNPNGDPDAESEPRQFDADRRGLISPVSFKRKLRDLMEREDGDVRAAALATINTTPNHQYGILESRGRDRKAISAMNVPAFQAAFWDGRIFGNTFVEKEDKGKFINTGVVQFGPGVSIAPVDVIRWTLTNKAGVQDDKDRGMAPLAFRIVAHGLYVMPFFVNPSAAKKSGCDANDIDILKFLIPYAYPHTASAIRPQVEVVHAWYAEHKDPLGSCPDPLLLDALRPKHKGDDPDSPSRSIADYEVPTELPANLRERLAGFDDLCTKDWSKSEAA
jgi:Cas7 group CRISPR-associated protein Csh2